MCYPVAPQIRLSSRAEVSRFAIVARTRRAGLCWSRGPVRSTHLERSLLARRGVAPSGATAPGARRALRVGVARPIRQLGVSASAIRVELSRSGSA